MEYRGYIITHKFDHYVVTGPDGLQWTEYTVEDAKATIDTELDN